MEPSNKLYIASGYNSSEENLHRNYLKEYKEENNGESLLLSDDIQKLSHRLNKISINELSFLKNLEEWRNQSHQIIDKFCKLKSDQYIQTTEEEINRLQDKINSLSSDHDDAAQDYIDWVKETIQSVHQQLDKLQQIQSKFSPLKIESSIICFPPSVSDLKPPPRPLKDLFSSPSSKDNFSFPLSPCSPFNFMDISSEDNLSFSYESPREMIKLPSDNWYSISANERHLLVSGKSEIFLIDHSLRIVNKKCFIQFGIKDICWSKSLSRFILITPKEIYLIDEKTFSFESCSISLINNNSWERGTSSDTILFLSTFGENPFIAEYYLFPSIHFNKRYQSSIICKQGEIINDIRSNENHLGLIIDNSFFNQTRFELRLIKTFESIWSVDLGKGWAYRSSIINYSQWIIADSYNQRLIHITNNGIIDKINNYSTKPLNIIHWGENQFVVRTIHGLGIHQYK